MKKLLPILVTFIIAFVLLLHPGATLAAGQPPTTDSHWVIDPEVTFIGKNARRSGDFLNWTLQNYSWVCVKQLASGQCDNSNNPIASYWSEIVLYIVVPLLFLVILATSIVIIITRGKSLTIMRFIPRFVAVVLLIVFSYALLQFFYQITDLIQGFFLRSNIIKDTCPPTCISDKDLLYVGWDYKNFVGLRLLGDKYAESAFTSLLLTKLTALTYFVMVFLLLVRKIILWFFIIVSPIFPILLLYYPVRNTGKIWIGEFFRWLLYAPLFAIFLNGLVSLWRSHIPLVFTNPNIGKASAIEYPTAVNILLGGPKQNVSPTNSVNLIETFALYVVSLIMLWIVILLPWILLQIFLDYAQNFAPGDTAVMKTLVNMATSRGSGPSPAPKPAEGGTAISLPFAKKFSVPIDLKPGPTGMAREINVQNANLKATFTQPVSLSNVNVNAQVLNAANIKVPTLRDIARFDIALASRDQAKQQDIAQFTKVIEKIANPVVVTNTVERERIEKVRESIMEHSKKGNLVATSIMNAAKNTSRSDVKASTKDVKNVLSQVANPALASSDKSTPVAREKLTKLNEVLQKQSKGTNNQLASKILSVNEKSTDTEIEKIRDQLKVAASQGDRTALSLISTINSASTKATEAVHTKDVLQKIANPSTITDTVEREKFTKLHDALQIESKEKNNSLASAILKVNDTTSIKEIDSIREQLKDSKENSVLQSVNGEVQQSVTPTHAKDVLQKIANPSTITDTVEREKFTKLHDSLQVESKEKNNSLASAILKVNNATSVSEIESIREQLKNSKVSTTLQSVNDEVQQSATAAHTKNVLQEVANPETAKTVEKERVKKLHESLQRASVQGNQLAASILSVNEKTTTQEIEALQQRIQEAKVKGEPVANEISELTKETQTATLPLVNRIQSVSKEDYQAVKDMWKQNYQNLEVPQGMTGSRAEWIKDDIAGIDETINLLSSQDSDKVQQGMDQVSTLLPFLLVGGFSQTEIIDYLKAKQEAAKEVSTSLAAEEEEKVTVTVKTQQVQGQQALSATVEQSSSDEEESSLGLEAVRSAKPIVTPQVAQPEQSLAILQIANLKLPRIQDIAQYETQTLHPDQTKVTEGRTLVTILEKIANPGSIADRIEQEKFERIRENLLTEKEKGSVTAAAVLSAANKTAAVTPERTKHLLSQIANPSLATKEIDKKRFTQLHDSLTKASLQGNQLAREILATKQTTTLGDIEKLSEKLKNAKKEGDTVISSVLPDLAAPEIPGQNALQQVAQSDYDEVRKMWEENYRTLPVPTEYGSDRIAWITADVKFVEETIALLTAPEAEKQQEGMNRVTNIMPMLLLGGFSQEEVIGYLKAKVEAGKNVLAELQKEEESKVAVDAGGARQEETKTLTAEESTASEIKESLPSEENTKGIEQEKNEQEKKEEGQS